MYFLNLGVKGNNFSLKWWVIVPFELGSDSDTLNRGNVLHHYRVPLSNPSFSVGARFGHYKYSALHFRYPSFFSPQLSIHWRILTKNLRPHRQS